MLEPMVNHLTRRKREWNKKLDCAYSGKEIGLQDTGWVALGNAVAVTVVLAFSLAFRDFPFVSLMNAWIEFYDTSCFISDISEAASREATSSSEKRKMNVEHTICYAYILLA
jgi:hypothetical protein